MQTKEILLTIFSKQTNLQGGRHTGHANRRLVHSEGDFLRGVTIHNEKRRTDLKIYLTVFLSDVGAE